MSSTMRDSSTSRVSRRCRCRPPLFEAMTPRSVARLIHQFVFYYLCVRTRMLPPRLQPATAIIGLLDTVRITPHHRAHLAASGSAHSSAHRAPVPFMRSNSTSSSGSGWVSAWSDSDSSDRDAVFVDPPSENGWFENCSGSASAEGNPWLDSDTPSEGGWHALGLGFSSEFAQRQVRAAPAPEPVESAFIR
ncbi:hypothetical protein B0H11DRAFT_2275870 [Mycena galericulata]|nr:hypothetical protein B0H11DRAFT_2275870 [Mycena galericulata]